jgi:tetratricopeptide (TPR) repeat protein
MYFDLRRYDKSIEAYQKAFSFLEKGRFGPSWLTLTKVAIARARVARGDSEISLNEVLKYYGQNKNRAFAGWIAQYTAETLFHLGDPFTSQAQSWAEKAIELDRQNGTRLLLGRDYLLSARIWSRTGNSSKAREDLVQAIEIFGECGAAAYLERASQELTLFTT